MQGNTAISPSSSSRNPARLSGPEFVFLRSQLETMGSLYVKGPKLWARHKDEHGVWKGAPTPTALVTRPTPAGS